MAASMHRTEVDIFIALCDAAGTPVSYKAGLMARRGDLGGLVSIDIKPQLYTCARTLQADLQIAAFFSKFPDFDLGLDRKAVAVNGFWEAERQCYWSNERISPLLFDVEHYGERIGDFVTVCKKFVRNVLGPAPSYDRLTDLIRFGPGATYLNTGCHTPEAHKLSDGYTRTSPISVVLPFWRSTVWGRYASSGQQGVPVEFDGTLDYCDISRDSTYAERDFEVVRGNRFTTVPKDAKKDRGICVEPSLNVSYQLAVGKIISTRMKSRLGWDKLRAQDFHKVLARIGSLTGAVATIDLSMASDTVCKNLVRLLLPDDWYSLLDVLRSSHTRLDGQWIKLEKFSSMGNGFTFELETLLFWALAHATQTLEGIREDPFTPGLMTSVYGDDIIVPSSVAKSLVSSLTFFGFTPNKKKTFLSGSFRESCGGDYFSGHDVRPHFQKEGLNEPRQLISLANGLSRFGVRSGALSNDRIYLRPWFKCLNALPRTIRALRGPAELGDLVIFDAQWESKASLVVRNGIRYVRVWRPVSTRPTGWEHFRPGVVHAIALWGARGPRQIDQRGVVVQRGGKPSLSMAQALDKCIITPSVDGSPTRVNGSYVSGYRFGRVCWS